jgi:hypothetical protein
MGYAITLKMTAISIMPFHTTFVLGHLSLIGIRRNGLSLPSMLLVLQLAFVERVQMIWLRLFSTCDSSTTSTTDYSLTMIMEWENGPDLNGR